ncbi:hypothetical protein C0995_004433, partial [Termitomyces sp. Mi166
ILDSWIVELEAKLKNKDKAVKDKAASEAWWDKLAKMKKDLGILEAFYNDASKQWCNIVCRNIGHIAWAPKISVDD